MDWTVLTWVDWAILALIGLSAIMGLFRGLIREVFSLSLWGGALWIAFNFSQDVRPLFDTLIPLPSARAAAAFAALFLGTLLLGGIVGYLLGKLVDSTGLGSTDRLAGLLFGVARGGLLVALLVLIGGLTPLPEDPWWREAKLIPPFQRLALWLKEQLPGTIAEHIKFPVLTTQR